MNQRKYYTITEAARHLGITRENAKERDAASLSTPLVKVDDRANIQTYIHVNMVNDVVITELEAKGVDIEITNASLKIIQGWIPFDFIEEVAGFQFVQRIEPPSYGVPRENSP